MTDNPTTAAGLLLLREWMELRWDHPPNTARVRDIIKDIEAEARISILRRPRRPMRGRHSSQRWPIHHRQPSLPRGAGCGEGQSGRGRFAG